ncbi:hypothetical protein NMG60_11035256 [Bertholletia excelsa]
MLKKLFGIRKLNPSTRGQVPVRQNPAPTVPEERPSALKIIHAGGIVESYYMAVPAKVIMDKYPSFVLARPDVFRRPWDAVVRSDEILVPGQKFYVVQRQTVKRLRRRIRNPRGSESSTANSFVSQSSSHFSAEIVSRRPDDFSSKSFLRESDISVLSIDTAESSGKIKRQDRHVSFYGLNNKKGSDSLCVEKKGSKEGNPKKEMQGKRRARKEVAWQPTLAAIGETRILHV